MTGEMSKSEVTREAFPLHFQIADAFNGTVEPFDVYQGPYVQVDGARLFIGSDDGMMLYVWNEARLVASIKFYYQDEGAAVDAAGEVYERPLTPLEQSIAHWERVVANPLGEAIGYKHCALCKEYNLDSPDEGEEDENKDCIGCPVYARTGHRYCDETPYADASNAIAEAVAATGAQTYPTHVAAVEAAQAELDFLRSLLP